MKKTRLMNCMVWCMALLLLNACKKEYITGGTPEDMNMYKNTSTYDVLKSDPLYDTLVQVIDAAGLKEKINQQGSTFFAPTDYSISSYLTLRTLYVQNTINQDAKFALDSLVYYVKNNINNTRDSLLMYWISQPLPYNVLTNTGTKYATGLTGDSVVVSYEYTKNGDLGYNGVVSSVPQVVYFTQLWHPYTVTTSTPAGDIPPNIGVRTLVKTSGINTQNGVMNALENSHTLFFYGTRQ